MASGLLRDSMEAIKIMLKNLLWQNLDKDLEILHCKTDINDKVSGDKLAVAKYVSDTKS